MYMSRYMPCEECGESVDRAAPVPHECTPERRTAYRMFGLRGGVARLERDWQDYLDSALGRFEVWLAAQEVRGAR